MTALLDDGQDLVRLVAMLPGFRRQIAHRGAGQPLGDRPIAPARRPVAPEQQGARRVAALADVELRVLVPRAVADLVPVQEGVGAAQDRPPAMSGGLHSRSLASALWEAYCELQSLSNPHPNPTITDNRYRNNLNHHGYRLNVSSVNHHQRALPDQLINQSRHAGENENNVNDD